MDGDAVQVALIEYAVALEFGKTAQATDFQLPGGAMNPLDPFSGSARKALTGVALVILNSVAAPLTLTDVHTDIAGRQLSYPATQDPQNAGQMMNPHQIPAARPYPLKEKHLQSPGGPPQLLAGLGVYRFEIGSGTDAVVQMALAFSYKAPGGAKAPGPFLGVAFRSIDNTPFFQKEYWTGESAVTADVATKFGDLKSFYKQTIEAGNLSASATGTKPEPVTIFAAFQDHNSMPPAETDFLTLKVWVRDNSWWQ